MFAFILRRLAQAVVVMVSVALIAFMLFQYVGDPVVFLLGQDATPDQIRELRADLGLDQPFFVQFWHFLQRTRVTGKRFATMMAPLQLHLVLPRFQRRGSLTQMVTCACVLPDNSWKACSTSRCRY